jgi:hypothetical protein
MSPIADFSGRCALDHSIMSRVAYATSLFDQDGIQVRRLLLCWSHSSSRPDRLSRRRAPCRSDS